MNSNKIDFPEICLTVSEDEKNVPKLCQKKYQKIENKEEITKHDSRINQEGRPQNNQGPSFGRKRHSYKRRPSNSRLGGPHREQPSNMRRHPNAKYNAPEKRKRLTMPSMRQQPSLSERTARYKKHASLKTSSEESESSKNNFKKMFKASEEKLRNHSQKRTEGRRTDSPAPNKDTENNAKNFPSRREPAHLGRSEIRASPMKTQGGRYLRDNRQTREEKQDVI